MITQLEVNPGKFRQPPALAQPMVSSFISHSSRFMPP
jgi:hypothetical protein